MSADAARLPELPPRWRQRFAEVLIVAFPNWKAMSGLFLLGLDESLDKYIQPAPMEEVVVEVLKWAEGSGRLCELCKAACRHKPDLTALWDVAAEVGWAPERQESTPEAVAGVQTGLRALRVALDPQLREALAGFRATFESADRRLQRVADYKSLHDRLHDFQFRCYAPIVSIARSYPQGDSKAQLALDALTFRSELQKMREIAARPTLANDDFFWIEDNLLPARDLLQEATGDSNLPKLQQAIRLMRDVVQLQPTVVNRLLIEAVSALDLGQLVKSLSTITTLDEMSVKGGLAVWLDRACRDLQTLHTQLTEHVASHRQWQRVDDSMRMFEASIGQATDGLKPAWAVVDRATQRVVVGGDPWATELRDVATLVTEALEAANGGPIVLYFSRFQTLASDRFYQVDKDLKQLCDRLAPVGKDLDAVVEGMAS